VGTQPGSRPNVGTRPSTGLTPGSRPNVGSRPSQLPANRPGIGQGNRPAQLPGTRPGIGEGGNRPGIGQGITSRPGISQLPAGGAAALPGLGSRFEGTRAGVADRMQNRPQTLEGRRDDLQNRISGGREDWQNHRQDMQGNRQDWRDQHREDWQNWADNHINNHGDWYHDSWHGDWYPGAGWSYMWDNYPVAAALGVTRWGINRLAWGFGYWGYSNPYYSDSGSYGYDYSQPIYSYADTGAVEAAPATQPVTDPAAPPADPAMQAFYDARIAFYSSEYPKALSLLDTTLKNMPHDSVVHEFRGLVLFAMQKYPKSAAAVYAVLSAGPGWDWTTLSSLYPSIDTYTQQLRALEQFAGKNPKSPDAAFLLGYHYLTAGHAESANKQFKLAQALLPNDRLAAQLVEMTTPPAKDQPQVVTPTEKPAVPTVPPCRRRRSSATGRPSARGPSSSWNSRPRGPSPGPTSAAKTSRR
jgi:tetratricopeptide (TPR) repeat protein